MITSRGRLELQAVERVTASDDGKPRSTLLLFISHAQEDAELAERLVDLVTRALHLEPQSVRCTSVNGYRLAAGAPIEEQLRREVHESAAFIGIVSPASLTSHWVLFELGARWGAHMPLIPLLAHGVSASVVRDSPLGGLNALRADDTGQLHQLINDLGRQLLISPQSAAVYERPLKELAGMPAPSVPPAVSVPSGLTQVAETVPGTLSSLPDGTDKLLLALAGPGDGGSVAETLAH